MCGDNDLEDGETNKNVVALILVRNSVYLWNRPHPQDLSVARNFFPFVHVRWECATDKLLTSYKGNPSLFQTNPKSAFMRVQPRSPKTLTPRKSPRQARS